MNELLENPTAPVSSGSSTAMEAEYTRAPAAAGGWFSCYVTAVGPAEDATSYIHLKEETGKFNAWYRAPVAIRKEMLATALTAIASNLKVSVYLVSTDPYSQLNRCYINRW